MRQILIISCLLLLLFACRKQHTDCCALPLTDMVRTQTQCADVWGYGTSNDETMVKLTSYLSQKQIVPSKTELLPTGEQLTCDACTCSKGYAFHVWVQEQYVNSLIKEGFAAK